jgi:hypothetical protein
MAAAMSPGFPAAALAGLLLWSFAAALSGEREPFDAPGFWSLWWPLAIALSFGLGALLPRRSWAWSFVIMAMMAPVMILNGAGLSMMPPGLVLLAILAIPGAVAGRIGAAFRRRLAPGRAGPAPRVSR